MHGGIAGGIALLDAYQIIAVVDAVVSGGAEAEAARAIGIDKEANKIASSRKCVFQGLKLTLRMEQYVLTEES